MMTKRAQKTQVKKGFDGDGEKLGGYGGCDNIDNDIDEEETEEEDVE